MGRLYIATIDIATATTARDIFSIAVAAAGDAPIALHEVLVTTDIETDANEEQIELVLSRRTGAFTAGSGGAAVTGQPILENDAADSATVRTGDTTQATGGTDNVLSNIWANNRVGCHLIFTPETRPTVQHDGTNDHALVLAMQAVVATTTAFGGHVIYEELV